MTFVLLLSYINPVENEEETMMLGTAIVEDLLKSDQVFAADLRGLSHFNVRTATHRGLPAHAGFSWPNAGSVSRVAV